jgi:dihydroceramidase
MREITSSVDWCEPNYLYPNTPILRHIAEQYNTWSALLYLLFSGLYLYNALRLYRKHVIDYVRPRFVFNALGLLTVGIGTFLFHATLTKEHQMLDEISMNIGIVINIYILLNDARSPTEELNFKNSSKNSWFKGDLRQKITFVVTCAAMVIILGLYDQMNPLRFRIAFGVIAFSLGFYCIYKSNHHSPEVTKLLTKEESDEYSKTKSKLLKSILFNGLVGFGLWLIERQFCFESLKLHAWWHYFTCIAAYSGMVLSMFAFYFDRDVFLGKVANDRVKIKWYFGLYPWLFGTALPAVAGKEAANKELEKKDKQNA